MSITLATGSCISETGADLLVPSIAVPCIGYSVDDPGNTILVNVLGSLDQPNTIRYSVADIADVFKNSPISPASGQSTKGKNLLVQMNEVWKITDTDLGVTYLPVSGHLVMKVPTDANLTGTVVGNFFQRLLGAICRDFSAGAIGALGSGFNSLIRGVTHLPDTVTPET